MEPSSPFTGTHQVKLVDHDLNDYGTPENPIVSTDSVTSNIKMLSITNATLADRIGNDLLIPGIDGKSIYVYAVSVFAQPKDVTCNLTFTDGLGGSPIYSIIVAPSAQAGFIFSESIAIPSCLFSTSPGNDLYANTDAVFTAVANLSFYYL